MNSSIWPIRLGIFVAALLVFLPWLGAVPLFDWDEVNFAEAAREMIVSGNYGLVQIDFKPFWEKPPLFIWMQVVCFKLFGIGEFGARLPNALCCAFTLLFLFERGRAISGQMRFGLLWAGFYVGSMLPQFYFRSGIIDPWFNLFIMLGIDRIFRYFDDGRPMQTVLAGVFIGLAVLTKGPVALVIALTISVVAIFRDREARKPWLINSALFLSTAAVVGFSWFLIELIQGRGHIIQQYIDYHIRLVTESEAGHGQPFYYHFIVLLLGCFPMSILFVSSYFDRKQAHADQSQLSRYSVWMGVMFWVVLIGFSIVRTKIIHYSSLCYFPMSFLVAAYIHRKIESKTKIPTPTLIGIAALGLVWALAIGAAATFDSWKEVLLTKVSLPADAALIIQQNIMVGYWAIIPALVLAFGTITSVFLFQRKTANGAMALIITGFVATTGITYSLMAPAHRYAQGEITDFYTDCASKGIMTVPLGFHSYAHLFYGHRTPAQSLLEQDQIRLLHGETGQRVLFIVRERDLENHLRWFPMLKEVDRVVDKVILERHDPIYLESFSR